MVFIYVKRTVRERERSAGRVETKSPNPHLRTSGEFSAFCRKFRVVACCPTFSVEILLQSKAWKGYMKGTMGEKREGER